jgi:hypothetical protein
LPDFQKGETHQSTLHLAYQRTLLKSFQAPIGKKNGILYFLAEERSRMRLFLLFVVFFPRNDTQWS